MTAQEDPASGGERRWTGYLILLYVVLGLVAVDVLVAAYAQVWCRYNPQYYRARLASCRQQAWDLVVVGGSPAMAIDAETLAGINWQGQRLDRVFNLALPLATAAEIHLSVEHALCRPPRLLVYGITVSDLNEDRVEPQGPCYLMDVADVTRWMRDRPEGATWCLKQFAQEHLARLWNLYYYRNGIRLWAADRIERCWPGLCPEAAAEAREGLAYSSLLCLPRGLVSRPPAVPSFRLDYLKATGATLPPFHFLDRYQIRSYPAHVHRLLDWGERHGVPVVLVNMPVTADLEERLHPQAFAAYQHALVELEHSRGVRVLHPTREEVGLTDADFCDLIHLNANGSARFSAWLRQALADLPDTQQRADAGKR